MTSSVSSQIDPANNHPNLTAAVAAATAPTATKIPGRCTHAPQGQSHPTRNGQFKTKSKRATSNVAPARGNKLRPKKKMR